MEDLSCLGIFCGRTLLEDGNYSECGACPNGFRRNNSYICELCTNSPTTKDWLFEIFTGVILLMLHCVSIYGLTNHQTLPNYRRHMVLSYSCAFFENASAFILAVLLFEPIWTFEITSCPATQLPDWYTMFFNPTPPFGETIRCTQEAVYPLYSLPFVVIVFSVIIMLLVRPIAHRALLGTFNSLPLYSAMWFSPVVAVIHALFGGLLYYSFPYITGALSLISITIYFERSTGAISPPKLVRELCTLKHAFVLFVHCIVNAFAIFSIVEFDIQYLPFLVLSISPVLFQIITREIANPSRLYEVDGDSRRWGPGNPRGGRNVYH